MRRQSMALAAPISRATRVGWFARFKQPYRIADLTVGARRTPPAEVLAGGPACGHRAGNPIPFDLQLHLSQDDRNGAATRCIGVCLPTPPRPEATPTARFLLPSAAVERYDGGQHILREPPRRTSDVMTSLSSSRRAALTLTGI